MAAGMLSAMPDPAWLPLLAKGLATALVVIGAALAAQRLGPFWGAILASLPVSAGPAFIFLALQQGPGFLAESALLSAAANVATGVFLVAYALAAPRLPALPGLALAIAAWGATALAIRALPWSVAAVVAVNLATYLLALRLLPMAPAAPAAAAARRGMADLVLRAAAVAGFVMALVALSERLGPAATGIAAVFPVSFLSLFLTVRSRLGAAGTAALARAALRPMLGFCLLPLVLHLGAERWGSGLALALAIPAPVIWSAGLVAWRRWGGRG
jgi:hypothetical protein